MRGPRALSGRSPLASSGPGAAAGALISKGGDEARRRRWQQQESVVVVRVSAPGRRALLMSRFACQIHVYVPPRDSEALRWRAALARRCHSSPLLSAGPRRCLERRWLSTGNFQIFKRATAYAALLRGAHAGLASS